MHTNIYIFNTQILSNNSQMDILSFYFNKTLKNEKCLRFHIRTIPPETQRAANWRQFVSCPAGCCTYFSLCDLMFEWKCIIKLKPVEKELDKTSEYLRNFSLIKKNGSLSLTNTLLRTNLLIQNLWPNEYKKSCCFFLFIFKLHFWWQFT